MNEDDYEEIAERFRSEAEAAFSGLDRSALGDTVLDDELFLAVAASELYRVYSGTLDPKTGNSVLYELERDITTLLDVRKLGDFRYIDFLPYRAEVMFWFGRSGVPQYVYYVDIVRSAGEGNPAADMVERVSLSYDHPAARPYFNVGIWDMDIINRLVAEGVDPQMAATLYDFAEVAGFAR